MLWVISAATAAVATAWMLVSAFAAWRCWTRTRWVRAGMAIMQGLLVALTVSYAWLSFTGTSPKEPATLWGYVLGLLLLPGALLVIQRPLSVENLRQLAADQAASAQSSTSSADPDAPHEVLQNLAIDEASIHRWSRGIEVIGYFSIAVMTVRAYQVWGA